MIEKSKNKLYNNITISDQNSHRFNLTSIIRRHQPTLISSTELHSDITSTYSSTIKKSRYSNKHRASHEKFQLLQINTLQTISIQDTRTKPIHSINQSPPASHLILHISLNLKLNTLNTGKFANSLYIDTCFVTTLRNNLSVVHNRNKFAYISLSIDPDRIPRQQQLLSLR